MGVSENRGALFGGTFKGASILFGVSKGYPYFGEIPIWGSLLGNCHFPVASSTKNHGFP